MPSKFVVRDQLVSVLEKSSKDFLETPFTQDITRTVSPDELTECERKIAYRTKVGKCRLGYNNAEYLAMMYAKVRWLDILKDTKGVKILDRWVTASDCNYNIVTKIDCVIEVSDMDDLQSVVYVKSLKEEDFADVKKNGAKRKDIVRVMADMWLVEVSNGVIIYENRSNLDFVIYRVIPQNEIINSVKAKTKSLYDHKLNSTIPSRPYKTCSAKECQECEFFTHCWEGQ